MGVYYCDMKTKKIYFQWLLGLGILVLIIFVYKVATRQKPINLISTQEQNLQRIKELTENSLGSAGYPDEKSATDARKEICKLTARSEVERDKAVAAVRNFLDQDSAEVVYQCSDAFYDTTNNRLVAGRSETYRVGLSSFMVNPTSNHVISANIQEFETITKILSSREVEELAKSFIANHSLALGTIDVNQYMLESGQKGNKDVNYFFSWKGSRQTVNLDPPAVTCSKDIAKDTKGIYYQADGTPCYKTYEQVRQPMIQMAFNNYGQLLNFANTFEGDIGREISF